MFINLTPIPIVIAGVHFNCANICIRQFPYWNSHDMGLLWCNGMDYYYNNTSTGKMLQQAQRFVLDLSELAKL
jgi:hypothetical protein